MMNMDLSILKYVLEIIILWFFYYMILVFIQGTRAVQVLKGIVIIAVVFVITQELNLEAINFILTKILTISVIAFMIIFNTIRVAINTQKTEIGIKKHQLEEFQLSGGLIDLVI